MADITSNLELHWLGDGEGSTLTDHSGGSIGNGTLSGNVSLVTGIEDHPNGLTNAVARTAGNGRVVSAGNFAIPHTSDVTIAFWLKKVSGANTYVVNTHDGTDYAASLYMPSTTGMWLMPGKDNANTSTWTIDDLNDLGWHHYAVCFDSAGTNAYFWQDGEHTDTDPSVAHATAWTLANPVRLFERGPDWSGTFTGLLADVRIYSRLLADESDTNGDVAALFAYSGPSPSSSDGVAGDIAGDITADIAT